MRQSDRSHRWNKAVITCRKCGEDKPPSAFIVRRKTNDCLGETCLECRAPRTTVDKIRAAVTAHREKARQLDLVNTLTFDEWFAKLQESQGVCYHCGGVFGVDVLTIDHLYPMHRGGANSIDNVVASCWECNVRKAAKVA